MKLQQKIINFMLTIIVLTIFGMNNSHAQWSETYVSNTDSKIRENSASITTDIFGNSHMVHEGDADLHKRRVDKQLFYLTNITGSWIREQVTNGDFTAIPMMDIALDNNSVVHVVYNPRFDDGNSVVLYTKKSGSSWSTPVQISPAGIPAGSGRIAVSTSGVAHIVFNAVTCFYTENSSGSFSAPLNLAEGQEFSHTDGGTVVLDNLGQVHIAFEPYTDDSWEDTNIYYTNNTGDGFFANMMPVATKSLIDEAGPSLGVDANGTVHIGYFEWIQPPPAVGAKYQYTNNASGSFAPATPIFTSMTNEAYNGENLVVDLAGNVHIVAEVYSTYELLYATNTSGTFLTETIPSSGERSDPTIAVDWDSFVHILADNRGSELYYYTNDSPPPAGFCFVQNIAMDLSYKGNGKPTNRGWTATATVLINDNQGNPVSGASVSGHWSGLTTDSDNGSTGSDGTVSLNSDRINATGSFTFTIDNVSHTGSTYDQTLNEMDANSISNMSKAAVDKMFATKTPAEFQLFQNHPNPFNPETTIQFQLPEESHVLIRIFNTIGQEIRSLVDVNFGSGYHSVIWDGRDNFGNPVLSGVYLYQLQTAKFSQVKIMTLMR